MADESWRIERHRDAATFQARAEPWLLGAEAEHNLVLGLIRALQEPEPPFEPPIYLATVEQGGDVAGCAFRTPPFKLGLTRMPLEAVSSLVADLEQVYTVLPAVLGPEAEAREFAERWSERRGVTARPGMRQRIYQLDRVVDPPRPPPGRFRAAKPEDAALLTDWVRAFHREVRLESLEVRRLVQERISHGGLWLWEDKEPRSMAAEAGRTPHGTRIGFVYTPSEWRGRGYASACVAEASRRLLRTGRRFCFLYTDLSNPTSNAIYQRIGYRPVCDVIDYDVNSAG